MKKWFLNLFCRPNKSSNKTKQIKDLLRFDDVYVLDNKKIYKGWVIDITKHLLQIYVYDKNKELILNISSFQDKSVISFEDKKLILNKEEICDYL